MVGDTYRALLSVGHTEAQARYAIFRAEPAGRRYDSVADMIEAIYNAGPIPPNPPPVP